MTDTFTPSLRLQQPTVNADKGVWGGVLNTDLGLIDDAITGWSIVPIGGLTSFTLSALPGAPDQARKQFIAFNGALTADCTVTIPKVQRVGWAQNATTGGHSVILTTGSGTSLTMGPNVGFTFYACDGTNVFYPAFSSPFTISGQDLIVKTGLNNANLILDDTQVGGHKWAILSDTGGNLGFFDNTTGLSALNLNTTNGGSFASSYANPGFERSPSGGLTQFGNVVTDASGHATVNFQVPFNGILSIQATADTASLNVGVNVQFVNLNSMLVRNYSIPTSGPPVGAVGTVYWMAKGF